MLPRSSARVGLTRFCFLLLCGSGQRPSRLFESVTSHFAFIRSSFTLSMWLNTFSCSVSHMTSLVLVSSCQGTLSALTEVSLFLAFPRLGFCIACPALRWCWGLCICLSGSCLLGTGTLYCWQAGFASVFSHFLRFRRFAQCGAVYIVQGATVCTVAQCARVCACRKVHSGRSGALWARSGAGVVWDTGEGVNALTGACRGLYGGLGVWDAVQRDSGAAVWASGARVDAHRGAGRVVWSGLGWGRWARSGGVYGWTGARTARQGRTVCAAGQ